MPEFVDFFGLDSSQGRADIGGAERRRVVAGTILSPAWGPIGVEEILLTRERPRRCLVRGISPLAPTGRPEPQYWEVPAEVARRLLGEANVPVFVDLLPLGTAEGSPGADATEVGPAKGAARPPKPLPEDRHLLMKILEQADAFLDELRAACRDFERYGKDSDPTISRIRSEQIARRAVDGIKAPRLLREYFDLPFVIGDPQARQEYRAWADALRATGPLGVLKGFMMLTRKLSRRIVAELEVGRQAATRTSRLAVDLDSKPPTVSLDGKAYVVDWSAAVLVKALVDADHDWVPSSTIQRLPGMKGCRPDRIRNNLPAPIRNLIESSPGKGYRIKRHPVE